MTSIRDYFRLGLVSFLSNEPLTRGAAIAFYLVTSIVPVLFITIRVAGFAFGWQAAREAIAQRLSYLMSPESAMLLQTAVRRALGHPTGIASTVVGVFFVLVTASGVFGAMEDALNVIWSAPKTGSLLRRLMRGRALSVLLVVCLGFLLAVSIVSTAAISGLSFETRDFDAFSQNVAVVLNFVTSTALMSVLFAAIYKILPNCSVSWSDVSVGAIGAAMLFQFGHYLLAYLLSASSIAASYGAVGGIVVLLLWAFYSAQVFLLGAEFTKAFAAYHGRHFGRTDAKVRGR
jgi:membrane protein